MISPSIDAPADSDIMPAPRRKTLVRKRTMSRHESRVTGTTENGFYALIVRIDKDGQENVIHGYKGRTFATREAGVKSTQKYMTKHGLR
jgi:hypothetical protein